MKKSSALCLILITIFLFTSKLHPDKSLSSYISGKEWKLLSIHTGDESHKTLLDYFASSQSIKIITYSTNKLTYKAKFKDYAEIGTITYTLNDGKYSDFQVKNQITPLYFINAFKKIPVSDFTFHVGEAVINIEKGIFFQSVPFKQVLFFKGIFRFSIVPSEREERLTLYRHYKKGEFSKLNAWGIFVLTDQQFLPNITHAESIEANDSELEELLKVYNNYFGIHINQFSEHWYLPFKPNDNFIIFKKSGDNFYLFDYNPEISPDTLLRTSENNRIILSYNAVKSAKIQLKEQNKINTIKLNLFYNPNSEFISGTVNLFFENPSPFKVLNLAESLKIKANLDNDTRGLSVVRKGRFYYFLGPATEKLSLYYSGTIKPNVILNDIFKRQVDDVSNGSIDHYYYLSRINGFYPYSSMDFSATSLDISVPNGYNCLASGQKTSTRGGKRNNFRFNSPGTKGISLVCGDFEQIKRILSSIPLNLFYKAGEDRGTSRKSPMTQDLRELMGYFNFDKLQNAWEFFISKFGQPEIKELNVLLQRSLQEGGVSNKEFIYYHFNPNEKNRKWINPNSPIILDIDPTNHLVHELSHQWWGGMISWKSYRDVWITEGLAHFSVVLFLKHHLSPKKFHRRLKIMKRWIYKKNDTGPIIYGKRLIHTDNDYEAYQSITYNKSAFVFFMLKNIMGEEIFLKRLKDIINKYKYRSISSAFFIKAFSKGDKIIEKFFKSWIYSREIPEVSIESTIKEGKAYIYSVQKNCDSVFPLVFEVKTDNGKYLEQVVVHKKKQYFEMSGKAKIKSIKWVQKISLVKLVKGGNKSGGTSAAEQSSYKNQELHK